MLQGSSGAHQETKRFDSRGFSQLLHFCPAKRWADGKFFFLDVRKVVVVQQGSRLRWSPGVRLLSMFADSKDLLPDVAMMNLSGTPCFESRCMSLSPNGWYRRRRTPPSTARRLQGVPSLRHSKLAFSTLPCSIYRSRSLLGCSCLFSCMIFLWNGVFLSAPASRSYKGLGSRLGKGEQSSSSNGLWKKWKSAFFRCMEQTISKRKPRSNKPQTNHWLTLSWLGWFDAGIVCFGVLADQIRKKCWYVIGNPGTW